MQRADKQFLDNLSVDVCGHTTEQVIAPTGGPALDSGARKAAAMHAASATRVDAEVMHAANAILAQAERGGATVDEDLELAADIRAEARREASKLKYAGWKAARKLRRAQPAA